MDTIELLDIELLNDKETLAEIDHFLKVFNWINGWHYDLDIIWILDSLKKSNIKPGMTILDAGAGFGMMQFILASKGYNVISLDFTDRDIPRESLGIFDIENRKNDLKGYTHEYMEYMTYGRTKKDIAGLLLKGVKHPLKAMKYLNKRLISYMARAKELKRDHSEYGKIIFLRGTFNDIPLEAKSVDALISVSAFEHNTFEDMKASVSEFSRVLKDKSSMFITTSAKDKTWYQEASKGWCFDKHTLADFFDIDEESIEFDYEEQREKIINSDILKDRLGDYYKKRENRTIPDGDFKNIEYIPVGIKKEKFV